MLSLNVNQMNINFLVTLKDSNMKMPNQYFANIDV